MMKVMMGFIVCGYLLMMIGAYANNYNSDTKTTKPVVESQQNMDVARGNWKITEGKIRARWGKLTDDDLLVIKGRMEELEGRIQKAYGYSKEKAKMEYQSFKESLEKNKKNDKG